MDPKPVEIDLRFWKAAYEAHGTAVLGYLSSRLRQRDEAEDLLHETFVHAIRAGGRLREPERVRAYLFQIAHRLMLNHGRKKRPQLFTEMSPEDADRAQAVADVRTGSPEDAALVRSLRDRVEAILETCPDDHRRAFRMAVFDQMPYAEIAAQEGWELNRVRINIYRARSKIIAALGHALREGTS